MYAVILEIGSECKQEMQLFLSRIVSKVISQGTMLWPKNHSHVKHSNSIRVMWKCMPRFWREKSRSYLQEHRLFMFHLILSIIHYHIHARQLLGLSLSVHCHDAWSFLSFLNPYDNWIPTAVLSAFMPPWSVLLCSFRNISGINTFCAWPLSEFLSCSSFSMSNKVPWRGKGCWRKGEEGRRRKGSSNWRIPRLNIPCPTTEGRENMARWGRQGEKGDPPRWIETENRPWPRRHLPVHN